MSFTWLLLGAGLVAGILLTLAWQRYSARVASDSQSEDEAETGGKTSGYWRSAKSAGILIASLICVTAAIVYSGSRAEDPRSGPQSLAPAMTGADNRNLADVDTMINRLSARLESNPDDGEGFRMLGWAYLMTDRPQQALFPYRRAVALLPGDASALTGYGEALTAVNGGTVSDEALAQFRSALESEPSDVRARYFVAKFDYQNGRKSKALDDWIALAKAAPDDAAWQDDIRRDIAMAASDLGVDVSDRLQGGETSSSSTGMPVLDQGTIDAAGRLSPAEQEAMVDRMVDGLAARLAENPDDPEGWARLIRSRMVRGNDAQASRDLASARRALAGDAQGLVRVNAVANELGVR